MMKTIYAATAMAVLAAGSASAGNMHDNHKAEKNGMVVSTTSTVSVTAGGDDIKPMEMTSGAPKSDNTYGTTGSNNRKDIQKGQ